MIFVACCDENNMSSEVKACFRWSALMKDYISAYQSQMAFMGLDFESDKPKMELRIMMAEL